MVARAAHNMNFRRESHAFLCRTAIPSFSLSTLTFVFPHIPQPFHANKPA